MKLDELPGMASETRDWNAAPLADLIAHLVSQHRECLHTDLPRLQQRLEATCEACRGAGSLAALPNLVFLLQDDLDLHMRKEERIVFPAIRELELSGRAARVATPIRALLSDHDTASGALEDIRRIAADYRLSPAAGESQRELFADLASLDCRLRRHMHLEENILFPRALSLAGG